MAKGRKPKPTKLRVIAGNPGKRPLNQSEPSPPVEIPAPPTFLRGSALEEWGRISVLLHDMGLLTGFDMAALAAYCQAFGRWSDAERLMAEGGPGGKPMAVIVKTKSGNMIKNPVLWVADKAMEQMHKFLTEFGMTPSSRSRVVTGKQEKTENPFAAVSKK